MTHSINWNKFKNALFKRFQGLKEEKLFLGFISRQQKGDVDEYTQEWETLAT